MPNDKYEDEIREILNRMDRFVPEGDQRNRPRPRQPRSWSVRLPDFRRLLGGYSSSSYLVAFVLLALAAGLLRKIYPPFGMIAALLSVACLVAAIALPMFSTSFGSRERRWRGQVIDYEPRRIRRSFSWRYTWWRIKSFFGFR